MYLYDLDYVKDNMENYSTNFIEFTKNFRDGPWSPDSIYIYGGTFNSLGLNKLFHAVLPGFDFYYDTVVTKNDWNKLYERSQSLDQRTIDVLNELKIWVDECFLEYDEFTIRGV